MVIISGKIKDQYWVDAEVKSTFRQRGDKIRFQIDHAENFTLISLPDAIHHNIDYSTFKKGNFKMSDTDIEAYVYPDCELCLYHNNGNRYELRLEKVLIPVEHAFKDRLKADTSRAGSDFLKSFKITYKDDEDGNLMLLDPIS